MQELLVRYLPRLRAFVRLKAGSWFRARESTSDLVQSVCREVLEKEARWQFGGESGFRLWLFTTAQRKIADRLDYWRAGKRDPARERPITGRASQVELLEGYRTSLTPSRHAIGMEDIARLEVCFDRLPEDYREAIVLNRLLGLSTEEVGQRLGRTPGASRTLLSRAIARLAEELVSRERELP